MKIAPSLIKCACVCLLGTTGACAIEKPDYQVLEKNGQLELRRYTDIPVASAPMRGMENQDGSFMKLFRYIQGRNGWSPLGAPIFAFYDPPWTPEAMRRNEVWLRLDD